MFESKSANIKTTEPATIQALIAVLSSSDGIARQKARIALVEIGEPAVEALIKALTVRDGHSHWEAAKALSQIASPKSVQALVQALEDPQFSIRWLAAEGLIAVGSAGLATLLQALVARPDSVWLREGTHHILHDLIDRGVLSQPLSAQIAPVLAALNGMEPVVAAPVAAKKALSALLQKENV
jgi:hypothetical protein